MKTRDMESEDTLKEKNTTLKTLKNEENISRNKEKQGKLRERH